MMLSMQNIIGQWLASLKHYLLMCLFLSSPDKLSYNPYCIGLTTASYFLIGLPLVDEQRGYSQVCAQIVLELAMIGLIIYFGLRWKNKMSRLPQTFSALVGVNMLITVATIPVYRTASAYSGDGDNLLIYATLAILVWNLAVMSLILKRALEISTHLSAMISFNYFVIYQFIVIWFY